VHSSLLAPDHFVASPSTSISLQQPAARMSAASVKLSPAIKALIALPSARGRSIPSPRPDLLHGLFRRVVGKGEKGGVGRDTWLTLCTAGVMTVNSPESLVGLYEFAGERVGGAVEERARNAAVSVGRCRD